MFILIITLIIFFWILFRVVVRHTKHSAPPSIFLPAFTDSVQEGDIVCICARENKWNAFELFMRPLIMLTYGTCFIHPVLITKVGQEKHILHFTCTPSATSTDALCHQTDRGTGRQIRGVAYLHNMNDFLEKHIKRQVSPPIYRVYRPPSDRPLPSYLTLLEQIKPYCGRVCSPTLTCISVLMAVLYKTNMVPTPHHKHTAYPGVFEKFLVEESGYHYVGDFSVKQDDD